MIKKFTKLFVAALAVATGIGAQAQQVCSQYAYFYSDINYPGGQKQSDIYSVVLADGQAQLSPIVEDLNYGAHIAFNPVNGLLYLVNDANGNIQVLDPANGSFVGEMLSPQSSLSGVTTATINEDGKLVIGRSNGDILCANLDSNPYTVTEIGSNANVSGGDLTYIDGRLLLAAKPDGMLNQVLGGTNYFMLGNVEGEVTGMATLEGDAGIIVSARSNSGFVTYNVGEVSIEEAATYDAFLDGEPFELENGDMASGCASFTSIGGDCGYELYYAHQPQGSGYSLNRVTFNNDGTATVDEILPNMIGGHIGLTNDGSQIYSVGGNRVVTYDAATGAVLNNQLITNAAGQTLSGFPAAVVADDGTFYAGHDPGNQVYEIDPATGAATPYGLSVNVSGGDLIFVDGEMWVISRGPDKLFKVRFDASEPQVSISVPVTEMNGAAVLADGRIIVADGTNDDLFKILDISDPENVLVENVPSMIPLFNGDFAGRCLDNDPVEVGCHGILIDESGYEPGLQKNGNQITDPERNDPSKAEGQPEADNTLNFVSLGFGGSIILGFDGGAAQNGPGDDLLVVETTYGETAGSESDFETYPESADVYVSQDGVTYVYIGEVLTDQQATFDFDAVGFSFVTSVKIVDTTPESSISSDAFDVDGISALNGCGPIPFVLPNDCVGLEVLEFNQGPQTNGMAVAADRSDATKALGAPDKSNAAGGFVSLGNGGSITIGFAGAVIDGDGADIRIFETSFSGDDCGASDDESADIELSQDGFNWVSAGTICRDGEVDMGPLGLDYVTLIRITSVPGTTLDGYDVDGVESVHGCDDFPLVTPGDCYATDVVAYERGTSFNGGSIANNRANPMEALGEPERIDQLVFVSLGYDDPATEVEEGSLILSFDGVVPNMEGDDIEIVETTYGNNSCASYDEFADVYVSVDGEEFFFAKTVCRADGFVDISDAGVFSFINYVKIVNNVELSNTPDAFDVDGVVALHNCEDDNTPAPDNDGIIASYNGPQAILESYPNPSSGQVFIEFAAAESGRATLEVWDMNGRLVETLFNQEAQGGMEYRFEFNGTSLPNGIYVTKLTTENETVIDKLMIAR
jgi:hypothetical protein